MTQPISFAEAQREDALDLLSILAPDVDAQQAQEFVRAFSNPNSGWREVPEFRYNSSDAYND